MDKHLQLIPEHGGKLLTNPTHDYAGPERPYHGNTAVHWPAVDSTPTPFNALPKRLQGMGTTVVFLAPNGQLFHLAGPLAGQEGVSMATQLLGDQQWPFDVIVQESAYLMGATIEHVNVNKRMFNLGVVIGKHNPPLSEYQYRIAEDHWWQGQDENQDGWMGVWTRFSGWRWIPVRPDTTVKTAQKMDTTAFGNNVSTWDISWLAARPYFTKPALYKTWHAKDGRLRIAHIDGKPKLVHTGTIHLANRGDLPSYVTFLVSSPGTAIVQDNDSERMVTLPTTKKSVGVYMCDTEPGHRTLVSATDPVNRLAYDRIRQSKVLDFLLHNVGESGVSLQLQFQDRFMYAVPPKSSVALTVQHINRAASITAILPQRFRRSR